MNVSKIQTAENHMPNVPPPLGGLGGGGGVESGRGLSPGLSEKNTQIAISCINAKITVFHLKCGLKILETHGYES